MVVLGFILIKTKHVILDELSPESRKTRNADIPDVLEIFTKSKRLTEEEVSVAKEKQICLVCKGKLERNMYVCPDCSSFYCQKCSSNLATLENSCLLCGV